MIFVSDIIWHDNNYVRAFADVESRDYGELFYNRANPTSYDSNHALILKLDGDLDAAIADVIVFYRGLDIAPRIYHGFAPGATEVLLPKLLALGFKMEVFDEEYFECTERSVIKPRAEFELRRVRQLDEAALAVFQEEGPWSVGVIERQLARDDYHMLAGYVAGIPVTMAALDLGERVTRVDDVMTHPAHRRQGYGRALMDGLVNYHRRISDNALYLYSGIPSAVRIYQEAGFRKLDWKPYKWSAWLER